MDFKKLKKDFFMFINLKTFTAGLLRRVILTKLANVSSTSTTVDIVRTKPKLKEKREKTTQKGSGLRRSGEEYGVNNSPATSSKKLIKSGLGFFLSPREDSKESEQTSSVSKDPASLTKSNNWDNEGLKIDENNDAEIPNKDYIDDIPIIPSLEDFMDDDMTNQISKAPFVCVKRVSNLKDLENDILRHSVFASLEELNLQVLIKLLHSEACLEEPDIPWTKDGLFNEVVSTKNEEKV